MLLGKYQTSGRTFHVKADDSYAYIADGYAGGFIILDISNPANPEFVSELDFNGTAKEVDVRDDHAFLIVGNMIYMIDISNPEEPELAASYDTPGYPNALVVDGNYIYVADYRSMLVLYYDPTTGVIDELTELPEQISLASNYPNPFNNSTVISYELPRAGIVTLDIYDILGRKITSLENSYKQAGQHSVLWQADGLSSGVYLYRLETESGVENNRMMLLK